MAGWACTACSGVNPEGTVFCGHCGTRAASSSAEGWSCRECGGSNPPETGFCGRCGAQRGTARQEELRLVTALFADISGFTTLADTLDIESLHDVINPLIAGLATIAEKYGGYIEKYAGDALLVVYGAPVTHEDDPQRALSAALDMHAELPRLLEEIGPAASHLTIHIGVNTGRVVSGRVGSEQQSDFSVLGDSVILAQRLESVCPSGQTYVGPTTYELAKEEFEFESVGALQLKGKLTTVEGFRLLGRRHRRVAAARPLIGRGEELAVLDTALDDVARGHGSVVTVVGEPGVGKTRLLLEAHRHAAERGVGWLSARCLSYGASIPYWPLSDLLRRVLGVRLEHDPATTVELVTRSLPADVAPAALRLLGIPTETLSPEQARRQVHDGVIAWLRARAHTQPLAVLVEDVHWVDAATLDVLHEIDRTLPDLPLLLALSGRPAATTTLTGFGREGRRTDVELGPLSTTALASLVAAVLEAEPAPALLELLTTRTAGNPLFAEELARSLLEAGALASTPEGLALQPGWDGERVPETVERVFAARLDLLPPTAAAVLQTASVVGRTMSLPLLRAAAGEQDVDEALGQLLQAGLLDRAGAGVTFHHALLQDVVYGRLLRKRRRELHRQVAEAGRRLYGDGEDTVDLLARHLFLAEAGEEAVGPLLRAGRRAARMFANEEAALHLERALEVLAGLGDDSQRRTEVELELAGLHLLRGDPEAALPLYESCRRRSDVAAAWAGLMSSYRALGSYPEVLGLFERASRIFDPRGADAAPIWLECANTLSLMGRFSDAISMLRTHLRVSRDASPTARGLALSQLAYAEGQLRLPAAVEHAAQAVALLDTPGSLRELVTALRIAGMTHLYAGDRSAAQLQLVRGVQVATRIGLLVEAAGCLLNSGLVAMDSDPESAAAQFRDALEQFSRIGHPAGRAQAMGNLADALCRAGHLDEAELEAKRAVALATRIGHRLTLADATWTRAKIRMARGQALLAVDQAEEAADLFLEIDDVQEACECLQLAADAARDAGDEARARSLCDRALALQAAG